MTKESDIPRARARWKLEKIAAPAKIKPRAPGPAGSAGRFLTNLKCIEFLSGALCARGVAR